MQSAQFGNKRSEKPPKLPPRDNSYNHDMPKVCFFPQLLFWKYLKFSLFSQPDYDDLDDDKMIKLMARGKSDKGKDNKKYGKLHDVICHFSLTCLTILYFNKKKKVSFFLFLWDNNDDLRRSSE